MTTTFHYGIPRIIIYILHILIGCFLVYVGYRVTQGNKISKPSKITLITLGSVVLLYQAWLWYKFPKDNYAYNVPGWLLHLSHILIGIFLLYLGIVSYVPRIIGLVPVISGAVAVLYMMHLWILK